MHIVPPLQSSLQVAARPLCCPVSVVSVTIVSRAIHSVTAPCGVTATSPIRRNDTVALVTHITSEASSVPTVVLSSPSPRPIPRRLTVTDSAVVLGTRQRRHAPSSFSMTIVTSLPWTASVTVRRVAWVVIGCRRDTGGTMAFQLPPPRSNPPVPTYLHPGAENCVVCAEVQIAGGTV